MSLVVSQVVEGVGPPGAGSCGTGALPLQGSHHSLGQSGSALQPSMGTDHLWEQILTWICSSERSPQCAHPKPKKGKFGGGDKKTQPNKQC